MENCSSGLQSPAVFGFQREDSGTVLLQPQHSIHVNDDENGNLSVKILNALYPLKAKLSTPFENLPLPSATLSGSSALPEMLSALLVPFLLCREK